MRNCFVLVSILALVPMAAVAGTTPEAPADAQSPASNCATAEQALFVPAETLVSDGPVICDPYPQYIDCDDWTDQYCTYEWNRCTGCCEPTYIAPGAYCPDVCQ